MKKKIPDFLITVGTGSVSVIACGATMSELFRNALRATATLMAPTIVTAGRKVKKITRSLRVEAVDINTLLVEFLSQVIGLSDAHDTIFTQIIFRRMGDDFLEGDLSGMPVDQREREIKSVSYQDVEITRNALSGMYETMLVFET